MYVFCNGWASKLHISKPYETIASCFTFHLTITAALPPNQSQSLQTLAMKSNDPTEAASAAPDNNNNNSAAAETIGKGKPVPNAKPRPDNADADDTYIYKDYAQTPIESLDTSTCHKKVPPQCLQAQKLPSKMALMLADPGQYKLKVSVGKAFCQHCFIA